MLVSFGYILCPLPFTNNAWLFSLLIPIFHLGPHSVMVLTAVCSMLIDVSACQDCQPMVLSSSHCVICALFCLGISAENSACDSITPCCTPASIYLKVIRSFLSCTLIFLSYRNQASTWMMLAEYLNWPILEISSSSHTRSKILETSGKRLLSSHRVLWQRFPIDLELGVPSSVVIKIQTVRRAGCPCHLFLVV